MKKILLSFLFVFLICKSYSADTLTVKQLESSVKETYKILKWQYPYGASFFMTTNVLSDDARSGGSYEDERPEFESLDKFELTPSSEGIEALWNKYIDGINSANRILTYKTAIGKDSVQEYLAQAKFLRAYFYFDFLRFFGKVPLITKYENVKNYPQKPESEIYAQIEKDLKDAIGKLKIKGDTNILNLDFATKASAQALLAKVYLYQQKWNDADAVLNEIIISGQYSLLSNFKDLWQSEVEHTNESIFEVPYVDTVAMNWAGHNEGNLDIQLMGIRGTNFSQSGLIDGWGFCLPTQELVDEYEAQKDSVRLDATVIKESDLDLHDFDYELSYDNTGFHNNKYAARVQPKSSNMFAQNELIFRYAEVLLMNAEVQYHLGNFPEAQNSLKLVRLRAKLPVITSTGNELLQAIQNERRLELALEGNRFFDLRRWGKLEEVMTEYGYKAETKGYLPIPNKALDYNDSLKQNSGYTAISNVYFTKNQITLFPNPVYDIATLKFELQNDEVVKINVVSIDGRQVQKQLLKDLILGEVSVEMQTNSLPSGVYTIMVQIGNKMPQLVKMIKR